MEEKNKTTGQLTELQALHKTALEQFNNIQIRERDQRALAIEDSRFVNVEDGQWDEEAKTSRKGRPRYTIDRTSPAIEQLVGDQRQNRTAIKVNAVSGDADDDGEKLNGGLIRNIEHRSHASNAYDNGYDETLTGGYGGWRILTQFNDDDQFEQDIKIGAITSAASSLYFGPSVEYDKRDATHAFLITNIDKEEFKRENPNISVTDFEQDIYSTGHCSDWFTDKDLRVAEFWVKEPLEKTIALMSDGTVIDLDEEEKVLDELKDKGITIALDANGKEKKRKVMSHKVVMYKMNGAEIYDGPNDWAGKYIPLVPEFGKVSVIEGKEFIRGKVRKMKDPQRIFNYATSNAIETNALTPKDPYWYTPAQALGFTTEYENFNVKNSPFMPYNNDKTNPGPPKRTGAPSQQTAQLDIIRQAENDLYVVSSMGPPSLGINPGLQSGVALKRQDEKGDRGSFIFQDNHAKSIQYTGDILLDLMPRIYDTERVVRILHLDGKSETVTINQRSIDDFNKPIMDEESGEQVMVNDLSKGKYSASVETGPAFSTQKDESAAQLIELSAASPRVEAVSADLIAKNLNILESDELSERLRKGMIRDGIVEPTPEEIEKFGLDQQAPPDPQQQAITDNINMETASTQAGIEKTDAETNQTNVETQAKAISAFKDLIETFIKQQEAGLPLGPAEVEMVKDQEALVEVATGNAIVGDIEES